MSEIKEKSNFYGGNTIKIRSKSLNNTRQESKFNFKNIGSK